MPTYSYVCSRCEHTFERFQKMTDKPVKKCPECGSKVERLITGGGGIIFKGDGFYCTDYRSESYKEAARRDSSDDSSSRDASSSGAKEKSEKSD